MKRLLGFLLGSMLAAGAGSVHAEDVVVTLWGTGMYGAAYAVGMEKGFFKEAGADITGVLSGTGGGSVLRNLLAADLPYGEVALSAVIAGQREKLDVVVVGACAQAFDNVWAVMPNSPIKGIADLVGKRVAYTNPKSISEAFLLMLLRNNSIDASKVTRVAAGGYGQGLTLMENGGVDVAPMPEPLRTMRKGKYRIIFTAEHDLPPMASSACVTTRKYAAAHADKIRAILEGRRRSIDYIYAHPEEAGRIMAKAYELAPDIGVESVTAMAKAHQWLDGTVDVSLFRNMEQGLRLTGEIDAPIDWSRLIDVSYLPKDLQAKSQLK